MTSLRGSLIYTAFATAAFLALQWFDGIRDWQLLLYSGGLFFLFTFFMLRLVQRLMNAFFRNRERDNPRRRRGDEERGPAEVPPSTARPDHVRRRRERRRRRR